MGRLANVRSAWGVGLRAVLIVLVALGLPLLAGHQVAAPAYADGTITVTGPNDNNVADNELTLREALLLATGGLAALGLAATGAELAACGAGCGGAYLPGATSDDTIVFGGDYTIEVDCSLGVLPALSDDDADNQGDTLDGSGRTIVLMPLAGACAVAGLTISGDHNTVRGIQITDSAEDGSGDGFSVGIVISGNDNMVRAGSDDEACQVSGADTTGIQISGNTNTIRDCFIGTDPTGHSAVPNAVNGVVVDGGDDNAIGVDTGGNVISGNGSNAASVAVLLQGGALGTTITDNRIGVDLEGDAMLTNFGTGISVTDGFATIGQGATAAQTNVIGGNSGSGIQIAGTAADASITNNYIGTNAASSSLLNNAINGIHVTQASGAVNIEDNVIGNNGNSGVVLQGDDDGHLVDGNFIGTNAAGTADLGNSDYGVAVALNPGTDSTISNNVIQNKGSGSNTAGIYVASGGTTTISGNTIRGQQAGADGVWLAGGDTNNLSGNTIGGTAGLGNSGDGIQVTGGGTNNLSNDTITFNTRNGIRIAGGTTNNIGPGDTISNNTENGVSIESGCAAGCDVNIGITSGGGADNTIADNGHMGIVVGGGNNVNVGNAVPGGDNDITGNTSDGIHIIAGNVVGVRGNLIDDNNTPDIGNGAGVAIHVGNSVSIGGAGAGEGNIISNNGGANIRITSTAAADIKGNTISGALSPNISVSSSGTVIICGTSAGDGNSISGATGGAGGDGVTVTNPSADTVRILGNTFSGNSGQSIDLDNDGVTCTNPASNGGIDCPTITEDSSDEETVSGTYSHADCPNPCRIEVYQVTTDNDGNGEGNVFHGVVTVTDGSGTFCLDLSGTYDIQTGDLFSPTASDANSTSEHGPNLAAAPTLGLYQPDIRFPINQAAKNAAGEGNNAYGAEDSGAGGQNNKITKGPTFKRPKGAKPPIVYSFAATKKNGTIYIRRQNDGTVADQFLFHSLECTRTTKPGSSDCDALAGLTLEVFGLSVGETSGVIAAGVVVDGDILLTVTSAAPPGDYVLVLNFQSVGDTSKFDSVTLRFKIK